MHSCFKLSGEVDIDSLVRDLNEQTEATGERQAYSGIVVEFDKGTHAPVIVVDKACTDAGSDIKKMLGIPVVKCSNNIASAVAYLDARIVCPVHRKPVYVCVDGKAVKCIAPASGVEQGRDSKPFGRAEDAEGLGFRTRCGNKSLIFCNEKCKFATRLY